MVDVHIIIILRSSPCTLNKTNNRVVNGQCLLLMCVRRSDTRRGKTVGGRRITGPKFRRHRLSVVYAQLHALSFPRVCVSSTLGLRLGASRRCLHPAALLNVAAHCPLANLCLIARERGHPPTLHTEKTYCAFHRR